MRYSRAALSLWYLLASANLPAFALDQLLPQTKRIASADFPCTYHDCGCKTAEQCRLRCCCHPKPAQQPASGASCRLKPAQPAEPVVVKVSVLSAARCAGHLPEAGTSSVQKLVPHLPPGTLLAITPPQASALLLHAPQEPASAPARIPDKVPIRLG